MRFLDKIILWATKKIRHKDLEKGDCSFLCPNDPDCAWCNLDEELLNKESKFEYYLKNIEFFHDDVNEWHEADTNQSVYEYLGITPEEYKKIIETK